MLFPWSLRAQTALTVPDSHPSHIPGPYFSLPGTSPPAQQFHSSAGLQLPKALPCPAMGPAELGLFLSPRRYPMPGPWSTLVAPYCSAPGWGNGTGPGYPDGPHRQPWRTGPTGLVVPWY